MLKISLDFDGTLGHREDVQIYCRALLNKGYDVYICTRRYGEEVLTWEEHPNHDEWWYTVGSNNWKEVYDIADKLGVKRDNIHFQNMKDKSIFFKANKDFLFHLDDDFLELEDINYFGDTIGVSVKDHDWEEQCNNLIIKHEDNLYNL